MTSNHRHLNNKTDHIKIKCYVTGTRHDTTIHWWKGDKEISTDSAFYHISTSNDEGYFSYGQMSAVVSTLSIQIGALCDMYNGNYICQTVGNAKQSLSEMITITIPGKNVMVIHAIVYYSIPIVVHV